MNVDNIDLAVKRIKELAKNKGYKMKFVCSSVNVRDNYFTDCRNKKIAIPDTIIGELSRLLETNESYLAGLSDNPLPDSSNNDNLYSIKNLSASKLQSLDEDEEDILRIFRSLSRKSKHEFMTMVYGYDEKTVSKKENAKSKSLVR